MSGGGVEREGGCGEGVGDWRGRGGGGVCELGEWVRQIFFGVYLFRLGLLCESGDILQGQSSMLAFYHPFYCPDMPDYSSFIHKW